MMRPVTSPLHLFRAFVSGINQRINMGFSYLTRIRFVGLRTGVIIDQIRLIPVEVIIQSRQLRALSFVRDIVPQQSQFRQSIAGVAMPQLPFGALQGRGQGLTQGIFHLLKLLRNMEPIQNTFEGRTLRLDGCYHRPAILCPICERFTCVACDRPCFLAALITDVLIVCN